MDNISNDKLAVGMGLGLFLLALVYCLTDVGSVFDKATFVGKYSSSIKYALAFFFAFITIVFKLMLVLLFIYVFIVIYNIVVVGVFKPLMSDGVMDTSNGFNSAKDVVQQAQTSYFALIKSVAIKTMGVVFGFINIPNTILLFFTIIPVYLLFAVLSYYQFVSTKKAVELEPQKGQKVLNTSYHCFIILIFSILVSFAMYMIYSTLTLLTQTAKN